MTKSNTERAKISMARRRAHARGLGYCAQCCLKKPAPGNVVCAACNATALIRNRRRRERRREFVKPRQLIESHERAGDVARQYHVHNAAVQHYQDALAVRGISAQEYIRIAEKLFFELFRSDRPEAAHLAGNRIIEAQRAIPGNEAGVIKTFFRVALQLVTENKLTESLAVLERALTMAVELDDAVLMKTTQYKICEILIMLGRLTEAKTLFDSLTQLQRDDPQVLWINYFNNKSQISSEFVSMEEALNSYNQVLDKMRENENPYRDTTVWGNFSEIAEHLGDIDLAKSCAERSLLLARQINISWRIAGDCARYAGILAKAGQNLIAYDYLMEALSCSVPVPIENVLLAESGIRLAIRAGDESILAKCANHRTLESALASGSPSIIGSVAAAFSRYYAFKGRAREARTLLHKALKRMVVTKGIWELPLAIALYGDSCDIPQARSLLQEALTRPYAHVVRAYQSFFEAAIAERERRFSDVPTHARDAVQRFEQLHWYGLADEARVLLPKDARIPQGDRSHVLPLSSPQYGLTNRERQVAELVLKGATNRAVAEKLSISERTVEAHMASIMNRLGIRSRHQLPETLPGSF